MAYHSRIPRTALPATTTVAVLLIFAATFSMSVFFILSGFGLIFRHTCTAVAVILFLGIFAGYYLMNGRRFKPSGIRLRRFKDPFPFLYAFCAAASFIGGAFYQPNNHDALSYRVPRVLQWLSEGRWHWIGGADTRMDFSSIGYEVMLLPVVGAFHTLKGVFLINTIPYLLLPGLLFQVFSGLGVRKKVAAIWMWIIPCGSCFVMQAGSLGNDLLGSTFLLASLAFGLKALRSGNVWEFQLAILAAALMTGMKASNLPLLLPAAICIIAALIRHPHHYRKLIICATFASTVSFAPVAAWNLYHSGDWTGKPSSPLKLNSPIAGIAGNSLLIGSAALSPAVFPHADIFNSTINGEVTKSLGWLHDRFPDFRMTHPQLASEENSGIGLGVTGALILAFSGAIHKFRLQRLIGLGGLVFFGSLGALLFYMMKLGNCGAPRLVMPYYAGLYLIILCFDSSSVFRCRWWQISSILLLIPIVPALLCSPSRPLLPMQTVVSKLVDQGFKYPFLLRMTTVYKVYADRYDPYGVIREILPPDCRRIGFAGTAGDSEYSFWLPLGTKRVIDLRSSSVGLSRLAKSLDAIVVSDSGAHDRFRMQPQELSNSLGWIISDSFEIQTLASQPPSKWYVIIPPAQCGE